MKFKLVEASNNTAIPLAYRDELRRIGFSCTRDFKMHHVLRSAGTWFKNYDGYSIFVEEATNHRFLRIWLLDRNIDVNNADSFIGIYQSEVAFQSADTIDDMLKVINNFKDKIDKLKENPNMKFKLVEAAEVKYCSVRPRKDATHEFFVGTREECENFIAEYNNTHPDNKYDLVIHSRTLADERMPRWMRENSESKICCICKKPFDGYGNNAEPVCTGSCCDECNMKEVIPARMKLLDTHSSEDLDESLNEGNAVSSKILPALDSFLQDIAQMYGTIDYSDIMDHDYTEDDIRKLNNLRRNFITWSQYDEDNEEVKAKFNEIAKKVAEILKRVNESINADIIPLEYDALTFVQHGNRIDVDDRDEVEYTVDWIYDVDKNDLYTFIFEECVDVEDFPDAFENEFDPNNEADWSRFTTWLDDNYDEIFAKYKDKILSNYEEKAAEDAAEKYDDYDYSIFNDPDWGPGSHHDIELNEAAEEDVLKNAYDQLRAYAIKDPKFFREHTLADAINELSERGILEIPAAYCEDPNNCTEEEADAFINDMSGYINNWRRLKLYYPIVDDSLDENLNAEAQNIYSEMKQWLQENDYIDGHDFAYDGEYAEFVDTLYLEALEKLKEETGDESIFVEPSIQGGQGGVFMFANGKNDVSWDFEAECETLLDYANNANTADEFVNMIFGYLKDKYNSMTDEFDDAEYIEEAINPSKALQVKKNSDADVIFYGYQYKDEQPVEFDPPKELSDKEYEAEIRTIVNSKTKLNADKPSGNRYGYDRDFMFYALFNRDKKIHEKLDDDMSYEDIENNINESIYIKRANHLFGPN